MLPRRFPCGSPRGALLLTTILLSPATAAIVPAAAQEGGAAGLAGGTAADAPGTGTAARGAAARNQVPAGAVRANGTGVETIAVLGQRENRQGLVPKESSAATKTGTPLIVTPESVSVVTRAQLDQQNARSAAEALRYTAGVSSDSQNGFSTRYDLITIRGFTANGDQYLDGLKLFNGAYYATQQIDSFLVDRYDILKGPPSVLYGQSDPGGVIAITSKLPTADAVHEAEVEGGSYGYVRGSVDLGGSIDGAGHWRYRLAATGTDSGTPDDHTRFQRYGVAPAVSWMPDDRTTLTVNGFYQHDPRGGDYDNAPIFGTVLPNTNGPIPYGKFTGDDAFERFDRTQAAIAFQLAHRFSDQWSVRSVGRYSNTGVNYNEVYASALPDDASRIAPRYTAGSEEHYDTITLEQQLLGHVGTGPVRHDLLFGVNWQNSRDSYNYYSGEAPAIDLYGPYVGVAIPPLSPLLDTSISTNQEGLFGEDQMSWGRWHAQIGGREDWSEIATRSALYPGSNADQGDRAFTWRAGLLYAFPFGVSPYFNYSRSFQPQTGTTVTGRQFTPTTGEQYEAGIKVQPKSFDAFITAALFHIQESNVLVSDPNNVGFSVQTGGERSQGVELEAHANITRELNVIASYTYQDATFNKDSGDLDGRRQTQVPAQLASVWAHYDVHDGPLAGFGFGGAVRYIGNTITDESVEYATGTATLVDAQAQYELGRVFHRLNGALLQVTAQNLLDKQYISSCYSNAFGCYFGPRRNVIGRLTYRW